MKREILTMEQGTPEWHQARLGIPTASRFAEIMSKGRAGAPSKTRLTYLYQLAGERITGEPTDTFESYDMRRGKRLEPEARAAYEFTENVDVMQVGVVRAFGAGASPDGLVGDEGMLEIKTALPKILAPMLVMCSSEDAHKAQIQGQLWIADRQWCDLVVYYPGMPMLIERHYRDEPFIIDLARAVQAFVQELEFVAAEINSRFGAGVGMRVGHHPVMPAPTNVNCRSELVSAPPPPRSEPPLPTNLDAADPVF